MRDTARVLEVNRNTVSSQLEKALNWFMLIRFTLTKS